MSCDKSLKTYVYVYVYVYVLSLRRVVASTYVVGEISIMVADDQHVDYRGRSYTAGYVSPVRYVFLFEPSSYRIGMITFSPTTEW